MPLKKGCSVKNAKENYRMLLREGYDKKRAYVICLNNAFDNRGKCSIKRTNKIREGKLFEG